MDLNWLDYHDMPCTMLPISSDSQFEQSRRRNLDLGRPAQVSKFVDVWKELAGAVGIGESQRRAVESTCEFEENISDRILYRKSADFIPLRPVLLRNECPSW